eukprot:1994308-Ditylum_brightwellii.AAC.1
MNKNKNVGSKTDSIMVQEEAEVDHFCWDESDDDEAELMKGVKKEEEQGKWTQEEKVSKRKTAPGKAATNNATPTKQSQTMVTVYSNDTYATKTVAERMKQQGEGYINDESVIKTPVEAKWVLKLGSR